MRGHQLSWPIVRDLLIDAKSFGFSKVRLYGGEPLIHTDIVKIVEHASKLNLNIWVTTNGALLKDRVDDLYKAGLRKITIGFYGVGEDYDDYVQRQHSFKRMEAGIAYTRERYGMEMSLALDWLLMRPTCNLESLSRMCRFAERYNTPIGVNLIHYSLPYFTMGEEDQLQLTARDRPEIEGVIAALMHFKMLRPDLILNSSTALRSIPDWLIQGPGMRVPCNSYRLVWVGADGTVQMCYVTFKLGNLHERRLGEMLFSSEHFKAARDAFFLNCPNCHCGFENRTLSYAPARQRYGSSSSHKLFGSGRNILPLQAE